jgi:SAM-dependent methyltransferase
MPRNTGLIVVVLFTMILTSIAGPIMLGQAAPVVVAIKRQEERDKYIKYESLIDALSVTRGMTILDIGSGTGYSSYLFAEKLQGSGAVFATDIKKEFVDYINDEAKRRNLANLHAALVKEEGLDDFYGTHTYDLVFASFVYHRIENPMEYFGTLRKFLKPNARLVLVLYNQAPLFSVDELTDVDKLITLFSAENVANPFVQQLSSSTKALLQDKTNRAAIAEALVDDFNRMLMNPRLYVEVYPRSYESDEPQHLRMSDLPASRRELANWLLMTLKEDGVLEKTVDRIDPKEMRSVIRLNRIFFQQLLGNHLANHGMGAYVPGGDASRHTNKYQALRELNAAGYRFVREMNPSPYFDCIVMAPIAP